ETRVAWTSTAHRKERHRSLAVTMPLACSASNRPHFPCAPPRPETARASRDRALRERQARAREPARARPQVPTLEDARSSTRAEACMRRAAGRVQGAVLVLALVLATGPANAAEPAGVDDGVLVPRLPLPW